MKKIFIAATDRNVGKTTISLALTSLLRDKGIKVGFCKPVGQNYTIINGEKAECDAATITAELKIPFRTSVYSPIIIDRGDTRRYINNPASEKIKGRILRAKEKLESDYHTIIYEGTGHPAVGSVIDHSNVTVAGMLEAEVILIAKGGIGDTLDRIALSQSYFERENVSISGVIINQVFPDKINQIKPYISAGLKKMNLRLLGTIPFEAILAYPTLDQIRRTVGAKIILGGSGVSVLIQAPVFGIKVDPGIVRLDSGKILMVSPVDQIDRLFDSLVGLRIDLKKKWEIGGVLLTAGKTIPEGFLDFFEASGIPVLSTPLDTYTVAQRLTSLVARIEPGLDEKIRILKKLFQKNVGLDFLNYEF